VVERIRRLGLMSRISDYNSSDIDCHAELL
jgi:hypothetical protein